MAQGAAQFCRRDGFAAVGGYDETPFMGENVDLFWRLQRHAAAVGLHADRAQSAGHPVDPRFDRWSLWRIPVMTNPFVILLFRRRRAAWSGWYEEGVR